MNVPISQILQKVSQILLTTGRLAHGRSWFAYLFMQAPNLIHDLDQALEQQIVVSSALPPDGYLRMNEPPVLHFSTVLVQCYPHFISRTRDWLVRIYSYVRKINMKAMTFSIQAIDD